MLYEAIKIFLMGIKRSAEKDLLGLEFLSNASSW